MVDTQFIIVSYILTSIALLISAFSAFLSTKIKAKTIQKIQKDIIGLGKIEKNIKLTHDELELLKKILEDKSIPVSIAVKPTSQGISKVTLKSRENEIKQLIGSEREFSDKTLHYYERINQLSNDLSNIKSDVQKSISKYEASNKSQFNIKTDLKNNLKWVNITAATSILAAVCTIIIVVTVFIVIGSSSTIEILTAVIAPLILFASAFLLFLLKKIQRKRHA